jgi:peroxiredoxin-like protein
MASTAITAKENDMEDAVHHFQAGAWWTSGRAGITKSDSAPNAIHFTSPPAFGGLEGRWTPEELLLCSVASCYTTTFSALADGSKLEYSDLGVEVEGTFRKVDSGYAFTEISIRPKLTIPSELEQQRALRLLQKAKSLCLVSRALSVEQKFEPSVRAGAPQSQNDRTDLDSSPHSLACTIPSSPTYPT